MHIDWWTVAFQTANVLILAWLLGKFLFRPVMDIIASRQDAANKLLADAAQARQAASEDRAGLDRAKAGIAQERSKVLADARAGAETARRALVAKANEEVSKLRADADAAISRDRAAMEGAVIEHARDLALDIARRLVSRVAPAVDGFLPSLSQQLAALSPEQRTLFTEQGDIEIVTAAPLTNDACAHVRSAVAAALAAGGRPPFEAPRLVFRTDPSVIAGVELRSRHAAVRDSWRGDLEEIGAALRHRGASGDGGGEDHDGERPGAPRPGPPAGGSPGERG